jgi:hypothetical protein
LKLPSPKLLASFRCLTSAATQQSDADRSIKRKNALCFIMVEFLPVGFFLINTVL